MEESYIELNNTCNQDCLFCIRPRKDKMTLTTKQAKEKIYDARKNDMLVLTGGEPTIRKDLPELVSYAKSIGIKRIQIQTNAAALKDFDYTNKLKESGLDKASVALHSHIKEKSDKITRSVSFYDTIKGILNLYKNNIEVGYAIIINKINQGDVCDLTNFIKDKFKKIELISYIFVRAEESALENKWIVPRYTDIQKDLEKAMKFCINNKISFNVEYVPLCFLDGFEKYSVEIERIKKDISMKNYWINKEKRTEDKKFLDRLYIKAPQCKVCFLNDVCQGIRKNYASIYGTNEFYPVYKNKEDVLKCL
ncbi:MAG: radical SAM protein [Candidatus Woesearchaeota archaeon]